MAGSLEEAAQWLERGRQSLQAARILHERGLSQEATSRAYYAMFYAAKAALISDGVFVSKHSAVIAAFGRRFAKTGRLPGRLHQMLRAAFNARQKADYALIPVIEHQDVERRMAEVEEFVSAIERLLFSA